MITRLTPLLERTLMQQPLVPVIIKTRGNSSFIRTRDLILEMSARFQSDRPFFRSLREQVPSIFNLFKELPMFKMVASILPRDFVLDLSHDPNVERIYPDQQVHVLQPIIEPYVFTYKNGRKLEFVTTEQTRELLGVRIAEKLGFDGTGITVAVIDTGAERKHEQLKGKMRFVTTMPQVRDDNGHGTHVATTIAGKLGIDEFMSKRMGREVRAMGMAPGAFILALKSLGWIVGTGSTSNIIEAIEIAISERAPIISMSLGGESKTSRPEDDPFYEVTNKVVKKGIIPVVAAGNAGPDKNTIGSPGAMPNVLTVGAHDPVTGEIASFSSRGPTNWGDTKPDVTAPGVNIYSGATGILDWSGDKTPQGYTPMSGTSMATPHVSGIVALMVQMHKKILGKELTVHEIKQMMQQLGKTKDNISGWGPINIQKYITWLSTQYGVEFK